LVNMDVGWLVNMDVGWLVNMDVGWLVNMDVGWLVNMDGKDRVPYYTTKIEIFTLKMKKSVRHLIFVYINHCY